MSDLTQFRGKFIVIGYLAYICKMLPYPLMFIIMRTLLAVKIKLQNKYNKLSIQE